MAGAFPDTDIMDMYRPMQTISSDLAVVPADVQFVKTITGNLHRGTEHSRSTVNNLGIFNVTTGFCFTGVENKLFIGDRWVIDDKQGQYWVVHGVPAFRNRFPATAHLRAVITLLKIKPSGIP